MNQHKFFPTTTHASLLCPSCLHRLGGSLSPLAAHGQHATIELCELCNVTILNAAFSHQLLHSALSDSAMPFDYASPPLLAPSKSLLDNVFLCPPAAEEVSDASSESSLSALLPHSTPPVSSPLPDFALDEDLFLMDLEGQEETGNQAGEMVGLGISFPGQDRASGGVDEPHAKRRCLSLEMHRDVSSEPEGKSAEEEEQEELASLLEDDDEDEVCTPPTCVVSSRLLSKAIELSEDEYGDSGKKYLASYKPAIDPSNWTDPILQRLPDAEFDAASGGTKHAGAPRRERQAAKRKSLDAETTEPSVEKPKTESRGNQPTPEHIPPRPTHSPTLFDELTQAGIDWCRFCGTTEGVNWRPGPWGKRTLCNKHGCDYKGYGFACKQPRLDLTPFFGESITERSRPVLQYFCTECQRPESWADNVLVRCEGCPKAFHQKCFPGGIESSLVAGKDRWFCEKGCRENAKRKRIVVELPRKRLPLMNTPKSSAKEFVESLSSLRAAGLC
ncbi:uncharacterized protein VTP21DRAFT_11600 [Calcarisporiella thermophila]|uniref:uncharacterized protein n=1 Tax=Calcarisporiella thermophila TaxID=911321 RepID=UPI003741F3AC